MEQEPMAWETSILRVVPEEKTEDMLKNIKCFVGEAVQKLCGSVELVPLFHAEDKDACIQR